MSWFRKKMWLAVEGGWAGWIDTPNSGADAGTEGWSTSGTFLNGGAYATHSWGTHKRYTFEWPDSSSRQAAQFMQSLRQGVYGKGLIHFIEPTLYDANILPARVAAPILSLDDEGRPLVPGGVPSTVVSNSSSIFGNLPVQSVSWNLSSAQFGYPGAGYSIYLPIPEGYTLAVGGVYQRSGSGGVFVTQNGVNTRITPSDASTGNLIRSDNLFTGKEARLWIGKDGFGGGSVTVTALVARLIPTDKIWSPLNLETRDPYGSGTYGDGVYGNPGEYGYGQIPYGEEPYGGQSLSAAWKRIARGEWVGGMGNTGCRFDGTPSLVHNTGVNGGQVGYAASFIEVGAW